MCTAPVLDRKRNKHVMNALIKIFELLFNRIQPLKQKITLPLLLPFFTGTLVLVFLTLTLLSFFTTTL